MYYRHTIPIVARCTSSSVTYRFLDNKVIENSMPKLSSVGHSDSDQNFPLMFSVRWYWLSFVDDLKSFSHVDKRRSFRRFLSPTLFHQSQDVWMHAGRLFLGKRRSIEWLTSVLDSLHDHCNSQSTDRNHRIRNAVLERTLLWTLSRWWWWRFLSVNLFVQKCNSFLFSQLP